MPGREPRPVVAKVVPSLRMIRCQRARLSSFVVFITHHLPLDVINRYAFFPTCTIIHINKHSYLTAAMTGTTTEQLPQQLE